MFKRAALAVGLSAVVFAPLPAMAREPAARGSGLGDVTARLADPQMQRSIAAMLTALSDALLDIKVAPLAKAAEAMGDRNLSRRVGPDSTLRDMAGHDAGRMQRDLGEKLPQAMTAMAGMTGAMEAMLPQLEDMARRIGSSIALPQPGDPAAEATAGD